MKSLISLLLLVLLAGSFVLGCRDDKADNKANAMLHYTMIHASSKLSEGEYLEAAHIANQAIGDYPDNPAFHEIAGEASFHLGQYGEAAGAFTRAIHCPHPGDKVKCCLFRGKSFVMLNKKVEAKRDLESCLEIAEKGSKEYNEASEVLEKLIGKTPGS